MANAIIRTEPGDTLATVAAQYYALHCAGGTARSIELNKVTRAIRDATPTALAHLADRDALPPGTTLFVPTLRELSRALLTDNLTLLGDLRAHGLDHARKLARYTPEEVTALLRPLPPGYAAEEIARTWMLTAFFNLDGMDRYTAIHLYDEVGIRSLRELSRQSRATLDGVLRTLIAPPHSRPPELTAQRHAERWIVSARILVRKRLGELTKIQGRFFQVPFRPALALRRADHYEGAATDESRTRAEAALASRLGRLYRFQAALLRGNVGVRSGHWAEAIAGYQEARRHWHRLAEETGVAAAVDERDGLNLVTCVEVARQLLEALPGDDDAPLDAPALPLRRGGTPCRYRLRGFQYEELAPDRQRELRARLAAQPIHRLPEPVQRSLQQAVLDKTWLDLQTADKALVLGLGAAGGTPLARDLGAAGREILRRNLGATRISRLFRGESQLGLFDSAARQLTVSEIESLAPDLWPARAESGLAPNPKRGVRAALSDAAQGAYPAEFLDRPDVGPFTKFVVMPGGDGRTTDHFLPLTPSFAADYEREILKPRLASARSEDLLFDDAVWTSVGAFAAMAPFAYASQIPLGLRKAYGKLHQPALAARFGGSRLNVYDADGALVRDIAASDPAALAFHTDLVLSCSTGFTGLASAAFPWELLGYAETWIDTADYAYRHGGRETARSHYADVKCAIETIFPMFADDAGVALTGVDLAIKAINTGTFAGPPTERRLQGLTTFDVVVAQNGTVHRAMDGTFVAIRAAEMRDGGTPRTPSASDPRFDKHVQRDSHFDK